MNNPRRKNRKKKRPAHTRVRVQEASPRAFTIDEFGKRNAIGRDKTYEEIREGRLQAHKAGRRTLIFDTSEEAWRQSLPPLNLSS
jgi:excisionase family DNA binding protein